MAGEDVRFNILADDNASRKFREVGRSALDASAKIDIAAASMKLWDNTTAKQGKAADTSVAAMKAHAKAASLLADAENVLGGRATKTTKLLADEGHKIDELSPKTSKLARLATAAGDGLQAMAANAGGGVGPMAGLVAAGAALAPVLFTIGTGLAGFGAAAYGAIGPIMKAAQASGGLRANMAKLNPEQQAVANSLLGLGRQYTAFEKQLQPEVLTAFGQSIRLAGHLMHDVEPVAAATGKAVGGLLAQIDAEFASGQWQSFFHFMATQAAPDMQLLGNSFVNLLHILPPLLRDLQPVSVQFLDVLDVTTKLIAITSDLNGGLQGSGTSAHQAAGGMSSLAAWTNKWVIQDLGSGGLPIVEKFWGSLKNLIDPASKSAAALKHTGANASIAVNNVQTLTQAVTALNAAESKSLDTQLAYSNALITSGDDAVKLRQALHASAGQIGLHTAAQRASFGAANTYISDLEKAAQQAIASGHGAGAAAHAIAAGLPILESATTHNRLYWQEVRTLKQWLDKLNAERRIHENVIVTGSGSWHWTGQTGGLGGGQRTAAAGMLVTGGTPGRDSVPILAMPGEAVVPRHLTPVVAPFLRANRVPGFASGGIVGGYGGSLAGLRPWAAHDVAATNRVLTASVASAIARAMAAAARSAFAAGGPGGGSAAANAQLARAMMPRWGSGYEWAAWNYLNMRESGWSQYATNRSSGAYGIPQALPFTKMPKAAWPAWAGGSSNPRAQIGWQIGYIGSRYGDPAGAASHERAFNWYDRGGLLPTGLSLAYNGTGRPEPVIPPGRGGGGRVVLEIRSNGAEESELLARMLRRYVRVKGGGDVQVALGST